MNSYAGYKETGLDWIGKIPKHWEVMKITHVVSSVGSGTTPKADNPKYYEQGSINWLVTGDLNDGYITETKNKITELAVEEHTSLKTYPVNSVLIAMYAGATIGKLGVLKIPATVNQATNVLSFNDNQSIDFWFYALLGHRKHIISLGYGGGQSNISQDVIKNLRLPTPPLEEQKLISRYLDKKTEQIDRLIEKIQKKIELLKEQRASLINQRVTKGLDSNVEMKDSGVEWIGEIPSHWNCRKLKYVSNQVSEKRLPQEGDIKISPENVESGTGRILNYYSDYDTEGQIFSSGDILFNKLRVYLNKVVLCDFDGFSMGEMIVIRPTDVLGDYLHRVLNSTGFIEQTNSLSEGVKLPRPPVSGIFNSLIPIPEISEQQKIINFLEQGLKNIDLLVDKYKERIRLTRTYRQSLISSVVTGKVRVTEDMV